MFRISRFFAHNSRRVIAIGAIFLSILGAIGLAAASQSSTPIWVATHQLAPGALIAAGDITQVEATLGSSASNYYRGSRTLIGKVVSRAVSPLEFIPLNALTEVGAASDYRELPLGIAKSDLPVDLASGERVDLYQIPRDPGKLPTKVATDIRIKKVDNKSRDLGGSVSVLFLLHEKEITAIMDSLIASRIVVVRNAL